MTCYSFIKEDITYQNQEDTNTQEDNDTQEDSNTQEDIDTQEDNDTQKDTDTQEDTANQISNETRNKTIDIMSPNPEQPIEVTPKTRGDFKSKIHALKKRCSRIMKK